MVTGHIFETSVLCGKTEGYSEKKSLFVEIQHRTKFPGRGVFNDS